MVMMDCFTIRETTAMFFAKGVGVISLNLMVDAIAAGEPSFSVGHGGPQFTGFLPDRVYTKNYPMTENK